MDYSTIKTMLGASTMSDTEKNIWHSMLPVMTTEELMSLGEILKAELKEVTDVLLGVMERRVQG